MAQSLFCRYKESFSEQPCQSGTLTRPAVEPQFAAGPWQLIIKISSSRSRKQRRRAYTYEAINPLGARVFFGVNSSISKTTTGCLLDAMVETSLIVTAHNFQRVLFLSDCGGLITTFNNRSASSWQDPTRLADLDSLVWSGFLCKVILVPLLIVNYVNIVAKQATPVPLR